MLKDVFIFTGSVPYDEVVNYVNIIDVCIADISTSTNDKGGTSAIKLYMYMACGKAFITLYLPGAEFVQKENVGLIVYPGKIAELPGKIISLLEDAGARRVMGENGRKLVEKKHTWKHVATEVNRILENP